MEDVKGRPELLNVKLQVVAAHAEPANEKLIATLSLAQKTMNVEISQHPEPKLKQLALRAAWPQGKDGMILNIADSTAKAPAPTAIGVLPTQNVVPYGAEHAAMMR
jgi:hypothetical protein